MTGQRIGYRRVSSVDQNEGRQLEGVPVDRMFTDKCSGKDVNRPELTAMLQFVREGDVVVVHSMDRLARNVDDLRKLVNGLTGRSVRVQFVKEGLTFTGDDNAMAKLLLTMLGAVAEFERALIRERQLEGIRLAKAAGKYRGRRPSLNEEQVKELRRRVAEGVPKTKIARSLGISRESVYSYLRQEP